VFVADSDNHRIQKFDNNGNYIKSWGHFGTGNDGLSTVYGIELDPKKGHVLVCNRDHPRIQLSTKNGGFIKSWGGYGSGDGEFSSPSGITVDMAGDVFVADGYRIQKFTNNGVFILKWP
jgi:DNA-binding beta-propeller fold protein YncE